MAPEKWQEVADRLIGRLYTAARDYDRYVPGDELRLHYRNDYLLSLLETFTPFVRAYFRYEVIGLEHIPSVGRAVLVSNHGILPVDGLLLNYAIKEAYGRWPRGLTDRRVFRIPVLRQFFMDLGIVLANPQTGRELLEREEIVFIMPGGAREAFKSSQDRYQLMWKRRMGFVRLAIRAGAPIIPVVCIGIDDTYHVLFDGYRLSERIFGKDVLLPVTIPLGLGPLPLPARLTHYVGKPVTFRYGPQDADDPQKVARLHRRVLKSMQSLLRQGMEARVKERLSSSR
jgi:1-acyl-sn-glycerol-3-phosphate acyltransferase